LVERGVIIEYLALFREYQIFAIPIIIVLVIFKSEIITDLQADVVQKILWSKSKRLQVNIVRFIIISILSAILIALIGNVTKDWWSWIYVFVSWVSTIFFAITFIVVIIEETFRWLPSKIINFVDGYPRIMSVIFSAYFVFVTYMFGYNLFNNISELVKSMKIDKTILILFGTIIYGIIAAIELMILAKVFFRNNKSYKLIWCGDEYSIICVTSDKMIQLEALDGSGYRFVEKDILKECIIREM